MIEAIQIARLIIALEPAIRAAIVDLIKAFKSGNTDDQRKAYEAARRAAFEGKQA